MSVQREYKKIVYRNCLISLWVYGNAGWYAAEGQIQLNSMNGNKVIHINLEDKERDVEIAFQSIEQRCKNWINQRINSGRLKQ